MCTEVNLPLARQVCIEYRSKKRKKNDFFYNREMKMKCDWLEDIGMNLDIFAEVQIDLIIGYFFIFTLYRSQSFSSGLFSKRFSRCYMCINQSEFKNR